MKSKSIFRIMALILTVAIIIATVGVQSSFVGGASSYSYWDGVTLTAPNNLGNGNYTLKMSVLKPRILNSMMNIMLLAP